MRKPRYRLVPLLDHDTGKWYNETWCVVDLNTFVILGWVNAHSKPWNIADDRYRVPQNQMDRIPPFPTHFE